MAAVEVKGLRELNAALAELPERIAKNVLRGSVAAGAAVIRKEAVKRAPIYTGPVAQGHPPPGTLKRAIYQTQVRELSGLLKQTFKVAVRRGKGAATKSGKSLDAYYARFVEYGTVKMTARPFMRPAFDSQKLNAIEAMKQYLAKRIPEEAAKLKR